MSESAQDPVSAARAVRDTEFPSAVRTKTGEALENMLQQFEATGFPRSGLRSMKISILKVLKKKRWTHHSFLHRGPKKAVEHDSDIHFDLT